MAMPPNTPDLDALLAHSGWVQALARSLVADSSTADDVEQQAWLTALERPPSHDRNLRSWWAAVVRSAAGKGWREQNRRRQIEAELARSQQSSDSDSPQLVAERFETFRYLATAVTQLPEPFGSAIYLRFFEQLPVAEVARRQNVPVNTAQSRINRGLVKLRAALQQSIGTQWRNRCMAFALPMSVGPGLALSPSTLVPLLWKSPLGIACTLSALLFLTIWATRAPAETEVLGLAIAEVDAGAVVEQEKIQEPAVAVTSQQGHARIPIPSANAGSRSDAKGSWVTVRNGSGGPPMPGAEVIALDLGKIPVPESEFAELKNVGAESMIRVLGDSFITDSNGQVRIPVPSGALVLVGTTREHFQLLSGRAINESAAKAEDITLTLDRVATLPVRVVDRAGKPVAGAWVSLRLYDQDFYDGMVGAETDSNGIAKIKILAGLVMDPDRKDYYVGLNILSAEPIMADFDLYKLPKKPVVLVMPETGQVEVRVKRSKDEAKSKTYMVGLGAMQPGRDGQPGPQPYTEGMMRQAVDGRAFFPYVALNLDLVCRVISTDYAQSNRVDQPGPKTAGEKVVLSLAPEVKENFVTGRVLNTEGMVAKNLALEVEIRTRAMDGDFTRRQRIQTNAEGHFRVQVDPDYQEGNARTLTVVMRKTKRKPRRIAEMDLSRSLPAGETDLGDFVVDTPPILVQGQVLSYAGEPVPGAQVELEVEDRAGYFIYDASAQGGKGASVFMDPAEQDSIRWKSRKDLSVNADDEGRFTIYARADDCRYRVQARHREHLPAAKEFIPGEKNYTIHLGESITIAGRILLDPRIPIYGIHVSLLSPRASSPGELFGSSIFANSRGYYEFPGQVTGTYGLRVKSVWLDEEFYFLEPTEINPTDGTFTFPDIDLRGRLSEIQVIVVDEKDKVLVEGKIDRSGQSWPKPFQFQPLLLVSLASTFDFNVYAEGRRSASLRGVSDNQKVVLRQGIPVKIVLDNMRELPADWDMRVVVYEVQEDGVLSERSPANLSLNTLGSGNTLFAWPGNFRLELEIYHARNNSSVHRWMPLPGDQDTPDFVILDHNEGQEIHLSLNSAKLTEALQNARNSELEFDRAKQ
jgi:RNA polymerase sigma factor (sigma-70 family)